jgi:proton glutamate symport protein
MGGTTRIKKGTLRHTYIHTTRIHLYLRCLAKKLPITSHMTKYALPTVLVTLFLAALATVGQLQGWFTLPTELVSSARWALVAALMWYGAGKNNTTTWILISMVVGGVIGYEFPQVGEGLNVISKVFIKLIKAIIAPLLFATLVIGIAGHSNLKQVGRMGIKSLIYFEVVTTIALLIGLCAINFTQAGKGIIPKDEKKTIMVPGDQLMAKIDSSGKGMEMRFTYAEKNVAVLPAKKKDGWMDIILHIFPENIAKSVADAQILQIVVFAILFAISMMFVEDRHKKVMLDWSEALAEVMFKFTNIVMKMAPFAIGGAIANTVASMGLGVLKNLGLLVLTLYGALGVLILVVFIPLMLWLKIPIRKFWAAVKEPATIAFATTSSESALPTALKNMEAFGVPRKIVAFVLPTGYSFNLDGSTLYLSLAAIFVAQATNHPLTFGEQFVMVLTLMLTSKGVAGVPRASLVILAGTCDQFGLEDWPIALILGVDALMDMARTATNLTGNCLATAVIARWENEGDF